jgi:hypothetical protein
MRAARIVAGMNSPLPFLNTYRTMRLAPEPDLRRVVLAPAGGSHPKSHYL